MSNEIIAVLTRASELIEARGWTVRFSNGPGSPMNLRCAISAACTEQTGKDWAGFHRLYCDTVNAVSAKLQDGVTSWEFGTHANSPRPRIESEVLQMLQQTISRLETNEARARARSISAV